FSVDLKSHTELLRKLFKAFREAGLRAHPEKCEFLQRSVKYVGHIFSDQGVGPDPQKLSAMLEFPRPRTKRNVKAFLGVVQYYRQYHKDLSKKAVPLTQLLKKDQSFVWTKECEEAFQSIREGLKTLPTLVYPDEEPGAGRYIIHCDASRTAIGGT